MTPAAPSSRTQNSVAPATAAGVRTQADEQRAGLRPYWVQIKPHQILGWMAKREGAVCERISKGRMQLIEELRRAGITGAMS